MAGATVKNYFGMYTEGFQTVDVRSLCIIMKSNDNTGDLWSYIVLPFFPESASDSKSVNWNNIELPGGSHPIYQFVSGGERTVSFTIKLIRETKPLAALKDDKRSPYNIDINKAVRFLRSCLYPQFSNADSSGSTVVTAPPLCKIRVGGNDFGHDKGGMMTCIMTTCDVEVTKWWDDAQTTPRVAEVSVAFAEVINKFGTVKYVGSSDVY